MTTPVATTPSRHIAPLIVNGLQGRLLHLPPLAGKRREILVVYGLHSSLEYWWPLAKELQRYGAVTMPDLPGFGGMQSFYRIHEKATLDNLADYLAALVKLRYRNKRFVVVGIGYGLVVVTRMLQRYPDLASKVIVAISLGGIARYDDIRYAPPRRWLYRYGARLLATRVLAFWVRQIFLHPLTLSTWYSRQNPPRQDSDEQIWLWRHNDVRTHLLALSTLMKLDNCRQQINRPLWHVAFTANQQLDHPRITQHLHICYKSVDQVKTRLHTQSLGTIDYHQSATSLLPAKLRRALAQL